MTPKNPNEWKTKPIIGFDTETYEGYVQCLRFSDGEIWDSESDDHPIEKVVRIDAKGQSESVRTFRTDDLLEALRLKALASRYTVAWNLGFDIQCILKLFVERNAKRLRQGHFLQIKKRKQLGILKAEAFDGNPSADQLRVIQELESELEETECINYFTTPQHEVRLIGEKAVGIKRRGKKNRNPYVWIFDAAPWYSSVYAHMALDTAAKRYLPSHEGKSAEKEGIDRTKIGSEFGYYKKHKEAILRYCLQDSILTADLMRLTVESFEKLGMPFPRKPFSRASLSREYMKFKGTMKLTEKAYAEMTNWSWHHLWEQSFLGGVFLQIGIGQSIAPFEIDLGSAYSAAMVTFPSLEGAEPVTMVDPQWNDKRTFFKFYRIRCKPTPRTPTFEPGSTRKQYRWGDELVTLCLTGYDLEIMDLLHEPYEILDAVGIFCPSKEFPLDYLREMYDGKNKVKEQYGDDSPEYANYKTPMNGTYGVLAQRRPSTTKQTNLIFASYTTAFCRRELWKAVMETERRKGIVLSLATDGMLIDGANEEVKEYWKERSTKDLGGWGFKQRKECVAFESGVAFLDTDTVKKRGFPHLQRKTTKDPKTGIIIQGIEDCNDTFVEETNQKPIKLRQGIIQGRTELIGAFRPVTRSLCPSKALRLGGFPVPPSLDKAPLKSYFHRRWILTLRGTESSDLTVRVGPSNHK